MLLALKTEEWDNGLRNSGDFQKQEMAKKWILPSRKELLTSWS